MDRHSQHPDERSSLVHDAQPVEHTPSTLKRVGRAIRGHKVELVTDAHQSPEENRLHREKVYAWLQGLRVPFLLASGVAYVWMHSVLLSAILFAISIPLPWIAVVIANGVGERRDPRQPAVYKPAIAREYNEFLLQQQQQQALGRGDSDTIIDHDHDEEQTP
ncbi:DUF3099 domain-containing protein [Corynebacterium gerontici]|uniref:DUF3099 domain-containing protein n=1 Tax=Corynebacterium gerontici TaxID=2079234 RepID=A0A3G6J0V1_9CORY|nr:DUF3099 domain-containing protein [Corynebacterium gerontici]AZA11579.1 hypothetical protein CGERO_06395 [Corynebacterium gerontici]